MIKIEDNSFLNQLKIVCSDDNKISKNKNLFKIAMNKYHIEPIIIENFINNTDNSSKNTLDDNTNINDNIYYLIRLKKIGIKFLLELYEDKYMPVIIYLNQVNNDSVNEILSSIFNETIENYFNSQPDNKNKVLNQSFIIFKSLVNYVDGNNCEINNTNKLSMLYCISYIKCYCYHLCKVLSSDDSNNNDLSELMDFLNESSKSRKIIKIYILRVLNKRIFKNYPFFLFFIQQKQLFVKDFDFSERAQCSLSNIFLQKDSYENYTRLRELYRLCKIENFKYEHEISKTLNKDTLLNFYDLLVNEEISTLCKNEQFDGHYYKKLCGFLSNIINDLDILLISKNILSIFYDYSCMTREFANIRNLSIREFEILLYSHKFTLICSLSKSNTFYSNILSSSVMENIKTVYIPGGEPVYTILMDSAKEIQEYFAINGVNKLGVYICSCGKSYYIRNCTTPVFITNCSHCNEQIGGKDHRLLQRQGHMRIFANQQEQSNYSYIPGKLLPDLLKEIEILKRTHTPGIKKVDKNRFLSTSKEVRNISNITYRLLSFIFYSCIFFDGKLSLINENDLNTFSYEDHHQSIFSILIDIWNTLNIELGKRDIDNKLPCFLNMVIPEISNLIINNESRMETAEERDIFEQKCNEIVESALAHFNSYYQQYIIESNKIENFEDDTIKCILEETSNITKLPKDEYPLIKYFST